MSYFEENLEKVIRDENSDLCQVFGDREGAFSSVALVKMQKDGVGVRHYHDNIIEIYVFSKGNGIININGNENFFASGDCYVIPPNNTHFVTAKSDLEFICICTPPWTKNHEFIETENKREDRNIEKYKKIGNLLNLSEKRNHNISLERLKTNEVLEPQLYQSDLTRVYYFIKGKGQIRIEEKIYEIKEGDCFKIEPYEKEKIIANKELIFVTIFDVLKIR